MLQKEKKWYESRTLWVSLLQVIIGVLTAAQGELEVGSTLTISGILMAYMRTITSSAVAK
jgi:hypothetical protein